MVIHNLASLSIIWLAFLSMIITAVVGLVLYAIIKRMIVLDQKLRKMFPILQMHFRTVNGVTHDVADRVVTPIIAVESKAAQVRGLQRAALGSLRTKGRM